MPVQGTDSTAPLPAAAPFAPGSISLRLYPHNELDARGVIREICDQAKLGLSLGFDGIMTSEHHGGFAGYLPNPLQVSGFILEETASGWVAPCPLILPLRPTGQLAEEIAWLGARHPGRIGLGVAAGALPLDFEAMEASLADAVPRFKQQLPRIVQMLRGRDLGLLEQDRALRQCAEAPIPVLSAAGSVAAAKRAAVCGAGIVTDGMSTIAQLKGICGAYDDSSGTRPKVVIRRVWFGSPPNELIRRQRAVYDDYAVDSGRFAEDQTVVADHGDDMVEQLSAIWRSTGADAINLRVHLPGVTRDQARQQIELLADQVLPALRARWDHPVASDRPR